MDESPKFRVLHTVSGRTDPFTGKIIIERKPGQDEQKSKKKITKSKKLLKKPKVKLQKFSGEKLVRRLGQEQGALVRDVPEMELIEDNRSLFFKKQMEVERRRVLGGFLDA